MRWLVLIIAMFQVNHRSVSIGLSHCFFRVFTDAIFVRCLYCFYLMPVTENKNLRLLSFGRGKPEVLYVLCRR